VSEHIADTTPNSSEKLRQITNNSESDKLVLAAPPPESRAGEPLALTPARLRKMVLDAVGSPHSKRNYAKALDDLFAFCVLFCKLLGVNLCKLFGLRD
jgi:hypothetical protein